MTAKKKLTQADKKAAFLKIFPEMGTIELAAKQSGISRKTVYNWLASDKNFKKRFDKVRPVAKEVYVGTLEQEAHRRAVEGVLEPVFYQGELVDHVRKFSDVLLIVLLKANAPEKYRERVEQSVDLTTKGEAIKNDNGHIELSPQEWADTLVILAKAGVTAVNNN